jgi:serine protease Do
MKLSTIRTLLAGAACGALALTPALAATSDAAAASSRNLTQEQQQAGPIPLPSFAPLAQHVLPAVVNISVQLNQQAALQDESSDEAQDGSGNNGALPQQFGQQFSGSPFDQLLRRFFENPFSTPKQGQQVVALGSGFVIDPRGYIVTNNHVVANAEKVTVTFQDQTQYPAKVVGRDQRTDLALLKINTPKPLSYVTWGNSDKVKVGDWVVAVGNPFGLGGTVTAGIVSALGRNIDEGPYDDFLQVDAPINRGNSGGPTFDLAGQVVGINTAIYSPSGGSVGIGFAIPSQLAKYVVNQLEQNGKVTWGWLGVEIQNTTPAIAKSLGLEHVEGALVASVVPDGPAAKAGLKPGDVIVAADDHPIHQAHDLPRIVAETPIGHKLDLSVERDGKTQQIVADIGAMPAKIAAASGTGESQPHAAPSSALGMQLAPLGPDLRKELKIPNGVNGVVVASIATDSPVAAMGVQAGDVIQSIDQKPATSPEEAVAALKKAANQGNILLLINRGGANMFVGLSVKNGGAGNAG